MHARTHAHVCLQADHRSSKVLEITRVLVSSEEGRAHHMTCGQACADKDCVWLEANPLSVIDVDDLMLG